jgi:hypothetical protein
VQHITGVLSYADACAAAVAACRGNHVLTLPEVQDRSRYAQQQAAGSQYGIMLWSLQLSTGCPNPRQILQAACTTYDMPGCEADLPFPRQRLCGNSSQPGSSPQPGCPGGIGGGKCGAWAGLGICCPAGTHMLVLCCSSASLHHHTKDMLAFMELEAIEYLRRNCMPQLL